MTLPVLSETPKLDDAEKSWITVCAIEGAGTAASSPGRPTRRRETQVGVWLGNPLYPAYTSLPSLPRCNLISNPLSGPLQNNE